MASSLKNLSEYKETALNIEGAKVGILISEWNDGITNAMAQGAIDLMIEKGAKNWNDGLYQACRRGHVDLINLMIEKGANKWNDGLFAACCKGHLDLIELMIEKGANYCGYCHKTMEEHLRNI